MNSQAWIKRLELHPHPEGGYFRETYRSGTAITQASLPQGFRGQRSASTAIYFLLKRSQISRFHRILSDEVWHHYAGGDMVRGHFGTRYYLCPSRVHGCTRIRFRRF
jgi:predicted cupin superfamily sugar epimerase